MRSSGEVVDTDVLVVGGGCAGCWAAIRARDFSPKVTLVDKAMVARSGSSFFCHDAIAPMPEGELEEWLRDVVEHGEYMSDQPFAEIMLREEGERIRDLQNWGVPYERDAKGELLRSFGRGHINSRVVLFDGRRLMETLKQQLFRRGVNLVERVMVTDLLTSDGGHPTQGRVVGAVGIRTRTGEFIVFKARAVILATGAISGKLHLGYADNLTGDAQAMALRAGAELRALEFLFRTNFACVHKKGVTGIGGILPFQTLGAKIVNALGQRFMERYAPVRKERRSTVALITQAMAKEIMEGRGPVYFDMRDFDADKFAQVRHILPIMMRGLDNAGVDPSRELVECRPITAYLAPGAYGGIRIDLEGQSSLPGLLAVGAAAHFAASGEILSGGNMAFCNVFGYRAGERAAKAAEECPKLEIDASQVQRLKASIFFPLERPGAFPPLAVYRRLNTKLVRPEFGIFKSEAKIKEMLQEISATAEEDLHRVTAKNIHELIQANEASNFVLSLEAIYLSALERKESRLTHYRLDYPFRDDINWLKWTVVKREDSGLRVSLEPLPVENFRIKPQEWLKVPAPIQVSASEKS